MDTFKAFLNSLNPFLKSDGSETFTGDETPIEAFAIVEGMSKQNSDTLAELTEKVTAIGDLNAEVAKISELENTITELKSASDKVALQFSTMAATIEKLQLENIPAKTGQNTSIDLPAATEVVNASEISEAKSKFSN